MKRPVISIGVVVLLYLSIQIPFLYQGINGAHSWRQSDTASIARNFSRHPEFPSPAVFLYPQIDALSLTGDLSGISGSEFPLYQILLSFLFFLTNSDSDFWGLFISTLSGVMVILGLLRLFPMYSLSQICLPLFCIPIFLQWGHKLMPEMFSLALMVWGLVFYQDKKHFVLAGFLLLCGTMARPFVIFLNLPLLLDFFIGLKEKRIAKKPLIMGTLILGSLIWWYGYWAPHLVETYGIRYFKVPDISWKKFSLFIMPSSYFDMFRAFFRNYANVILIIPFLWGFIRLVRQGVPPLERRLLAAAGLALTVLPLITSPGFIKTHFYYLIVCIPAVVIVLGKFFSEIKQRQLPFILAGGLVLILIIYFILEKETVGLVASSFLAPVVFLLLQKLYRLHVFEKRKYIFFILFGIYLPIGWSLGEWVRVKPSIKSIREIRQEVWQKTKPDDLFVHHDNDPITRLYQLRRRGFRLSKNKIETLIEYPTQENTAPFRKLGIKWILYAANDKDYVLKRLGP